MGALFDRIKEWTATEDVTSDDLNAEFDNILDNLVPLFFDDYSASIGQMQVTTDPGEVGTESLATTLAGEIERLRNMILEISGMNEWYETPPVSLIGLSNAIGTGITDNRLISGRIRTTSEQPLFLVPNGASKTVTLKGATTNFIYTINGTEYTISTDVNLTGLTAAPSTNNTCLVNDTNLSGQEFTKFLGENGTEIPIDTQGSEITALVGKLAAFKVGATEYFIARVETNKLVNARRGYFFDFTDVPVTRVVLSDNNTITLIKLTWVFAKTDGTLTATYSPPTWSKDEPSSPSSNDYWFDQANNTWKVYGIGFTVANAILVGVCTQDTTNTIAARSFEFFLNYDSINTNEIIFSTNSQVKSHRIGSEINAWGSVIKDEFFSTVWDMTSDLDTGVTEAASTYYFFYRTEVGDKVISNIRPFNRTEDLKGYYHPHQSWRCVGFAFNDGSSNLTRVNSYYERYGTGNLLSAQSAAISLDSSYQMIPVTGSSSFIITLPPAVHCPKKRVMFYRTDDSPSNVVTISRSLSDTIGSSSATSVHLVTQDEVWILISDGISNWIVESHRQKSGWTAYTPTLVGFGIPTLISFLWRRIGESIELKGTFTSGAATGATGSVTLPMNLVIDSAKVTINNLVSAPGPAQGFWALNGNNNRAGVIITATATSTTLFYFGPDESSATALVPANGSTIAANTNIVTLFSSFPISGWEI